MNKTVIILVQTNLAFLLIVVAYTEASSKRCGPVCRKNVPSKVRCVRDGRICRKIRQCSLQEENCRRDQLKHSRLNPTSLAVCRNIKSSLGSGRCAPIRKPRSIRPNCNRIRCSVPSKGLVCYRSRKNNCRLLTDCQVIRANCRRGPSNRLQVTDSRACVGLKAAGRIQRCRPIPKRG